MALSPFQRAALKEQEEKKQKTTTTKSSTPSPFERAAQKEQASGSGYQRPAVIGSALDVQRRYQESQKPRDYLSEARRANEKTIDTGNSMTDDERAKRRTELNSRMQELEKDRSRYNSALAAGLASGRLENEIRSRVNDINAQLRELQNELRDVERGRYISEREQLTDALSERQEATRNARDVMQEYTGGIDDYELASAIANDPGTWSRIYEAVRDARDDEYRAQRQIDQLDYLNKYMDRSYTEDAQADSFGDKWNNFWQQSRANYDVGRIGQDVNQAYTDYLNSGRYEDRNYAQALAQLDADFQRRNAAVLDDENQVLPWISQSAANYVPQFIDQTNAQLGGGAIGAAAGLFVGNPIAGAKAGAVAGSGRYSYDQMRGAAYRTMIEAGIDDATARAAANDEALISALIEMRDTALDMMLFGGNKALDAVGKAAGLGKSSAEKAVAGALGNRATKKAAKEAVKLAAKPTTMKAIENVAGRIALGAASEAFEEGTQEAVSIANEKRGGTGGKLNLVKGALNVLFQSMTGQDGESAARIKEAAGEGAKISLMFGTGTLATNTAITKAANHAEMVSLGNEYRGRESQVIESALKQNEDTTAYQMAEELKEQEKISDAELGRLVYANQLAETEKLISTYKDDTDTLKALISEGKESGKGTVSYKVAQRIENKLNSNKEITTGDVERLIAANQVYINAEETSQAAQTEQTRTHFGYGQNGEKAFESLLENSNMTVDEAKSRFQSAYEAGRTNLPAQMASLTDKVQIAAFQAGLQDYNLDTRKTFSATLHGTESGLVENELSKSIPQSKAALVNDVSKALGIKTVMQERIVAGTGEANASMSSNGILSLSSRSDKPIIVAVAHEGTHRMQQLAPREYTDFRNFAVQQMEKGRPDSAGTLVEAVQARAAEQNVYLSTEGAMDEIAAEYAENLFGDEDKLRTALNEAVGDAKTRKSMNKFFEIVHKLIQKLKKLLPKYRGEERKQLQSDIDAMQKGEQLWKDMLAASIKAVDDRAPAMTEAVELSDVNTQFSIREKDPPKKIGIAYKVFMAKDGQLYPPMVANPGGEGTPVGVWLDADVGKAAPPSKTGRPQVQGGGKGTNSGKISLAFRPGWHLGDVPLATQFARKNPETGKKDLFPSNFVWAECEYAMDVDYQEEAMSYGYTENGKFRHSYAGLPKLPTDGYYRYRTNPNPDTVPWIITGAMRVKRILTDAETDAICRENGVEPMKREGGPIDLEKYGIKAGEQYSLKDTVTNKAGDIVAEFHPNGSAQFSLKTYSEDGRTNLKKWLDKRVASNAISKADADDIVRQLDDFYDICQKFVGKYAPFGAWSNAEVVRDAKGKPVFSVVKANGEYSMNLDFSLVCKKRRTLDAVFKELINRGSLDQMEMGEEQIASINQIIRESGFETACALCFVDSKRYRQANVADNFVKQYNELVNMLVPDGSNIKAHHFDFLSRGTNDEGRALHTVPNSELGKGIVKLKKVMQENGKLTVAHKIASHLLNNPQDRKLVMRSEFMNTDGFEAVTLKNRKVLGLYNSSKGSGGPKASLSDVQYLGDILKKNNFTPAKAYAVGGVRIQSFSDYIPRLVFDYLQMTADLAAKKLPAHAYTKEEMFAKQFGMTGIKINMSLVPAVVKDGVAPGLDANGEYVWYDGQSFGSDVNVKGSGQTGFKTAVEIQNASGYSSNCGTIAVGISDEHIWKMLDDSDIRMVIPYHKSSLNHIVAVMNNIDQYKDYTGVQNTRDAKTGSKITGKDFNYNEALRRLGDAKAAANEYLEWCDDNGYLPKFDTFAGHENYYKLLEDFSTYDNGEAAPQGPVTMTFPKSGDAFGSMAQLIEDGLEEDAVLEARREKSVPGIVDKIEGVLKSRGTPADAQYSLKDSEGNHLTQEQAEFFKDSKVRDENGNLMVVYHGTNQGNFTEFMWDETQRADGGFYGRGHYFTSKKGMAEIYGARVLNGYLNIKKPFVWDEEINSYNGNRPTNILVRNIVSRINMARVFPDLFANNTMEYGVLNNRTGEMEEKSIKWSELEKEITKTMGTLKPLVFADDSVQWAYPGDLWDHNVGDRYASMADAESHKFDAAVQAFVDTHTGIAYRMTVDDQTSWTSDYGSEISDTLMAMGYDGAMQDRAGTEIVAFKSNQFKEIDNTNPTSDPDFRFSLKGQNDLLKQNARLKEVNETLREQMKLTTFAKVDKKSLDNFTKNLLKDYQSGAEINDVRAMLEGLYNYMANGEGETKTPIWNVVQKVAYDTAVQILENVSVRNDELYQTYSELRHTVRTTGITLSQQDRADVSDGYDTFRKDNLGKIKLVNNGIPVDTFYQELAGRYPEFFDEAEHSHPADQLEHIAEVLDSLNPFDENPYSLNMRESATWLANDIIERFFELPQAKPTFADKAKAKQDRTRAQGAQRLERLREQKNERIANIIADNREKLNETRQKERSKRNEAVKQVKEHYKAKESKMSESRKARVLREKIIRHAGELSRKLISPTDKQHIPQQLQGAVAELLASINLESNYTYDTESQSYKKSDDGLPTRRTRAFAELRTLYTQMANELTIDPDLMGDDGLLSDVAKLADKRIVDMTTSELETIWQTMRAVEATISTANRALSKSRWATISEFADVLRESNKNKKPPAEYRGVIGTLQNIAVLEMETPETYFHMLGEGGDAIFRMMRNAQDDHIRMMKEVADFTNSALKGVDVRKLESTMHTVTLGGEKVTLSTAQLMELYVLMRREQARDHIFVGGILPDVLDTKGIRKVTKAKPVRGITLEEVSKAVSRLTDSQKKTAEKLQEFASTKLSEYGNKASMQVYGYEKFGEKTYWPIRVNRQEVRSDIQKDSAIVAMVNKGFTKGTKPHANNSVRLGSIFDTFASHATDMASYSAWLGVTEDVNRIRNYTFRNDAGRAVDTVKAIIESVHGSRGGNYLAKLLGDVANGVKSTHGETDYMSGWIGNFKAAAVGANLRVMIQQPTAILRAMDMIGAQYMAVPGNPMSGWKKAMKYAPIAQWKDWGYFDINTGRQMKDVLFNTDSGLDKVRNFSMAGAGFMDSLSWGHLWNAVEAETKAKRKELKAGSEEFYKAVAERFTEIVDHTQVVDGILQRSQMMRTADTGKKMATAFMAEPTKQYNMMMQALYDMTKADKKRRSASARGFLRTAAALAVAGVVNAAAQSIMDAMRDDDKEKKYWEKWFEAFIGKTDEGTDIIGSNVGDAFNPISYIPFVKDVGSLVAGYDVERTDMAVFKDIIDAGRALMKALDSEGKQSKPGAIINFVSVLSGAFGLSASNLKREIHSFTTTYAIQTDNYLMQYRMDKFWLSLNTSANTKRFVDILYNAYKNDQDAYKIIYADMVDSGFDVEKIQKGMDDRLKADQGVNSVDELTQRFLPPDKHPEYDKSVRKIQSNNLWKSANAEQKKDLENRLYDLATGNKAGAGMEEDISDGAKYGIDDTDYLLYKMAMEMFDTPNEKGKYGTYTNAEKAEAITSMSGLTDAEMAWMWGNTTTSDEVWDAYNAGVDMEDYMAFKGAIDDIHADKNANGKTIKDSRKRKVIEMLNGMDLTDDEWNFLYHLEYK